MIEVVTLTSTLTYTCENRVTGVLDRDVTDQLHHVYGFTYTGTTEQAYLTPFRKRADQVDYLDAGFQQFVGRGLLSIGRCFAVNRRNALLHQLDLFRQLALPRTFIIRPKVAWYLLEPEWARYQYSITVKTTGRQSF